MFRILELFVADVESLKFELRHRLNEFLTLFIDIYDCFSLANLKVVQNQLRCLVQGQYKKSFLLCQTRFFVAKMLSSGALGVEENEAATPVSQASQSASRVFLEEDEQLEHMSKPLQILYQFYVNLDKHELNYSENVSNN
jgi:hypothetical protein